jgi:hypothetical protein
MQNLDVDAGVALPPPALQVSPPPPHDTGGSGQAGLDSIEGKRRFGSLLRSDMVVRCCANGGAGDSAVIRCCCCWPARRSRLAATEAGI